MPVEMRRDNRNFDLWKEGHQILKKKGMNPGRLLHNKLKEETLNADVIFDRAHT